MDKNISDPRPAVKPEPADAAPTPTPDGELSTDDLNKVSGGSRLEELGHDMRKGIVANFRV